MIKSICLVLQFTRDRFSEKCIVISYFPAQILRKNDEVNISLKDKWVLSHWAR